MVSLVGVLDDYDLGLCWNGLSDVVLQRHTILGLLHFERMDCHGCGGSGLALIGKMRDFVFWVSRCFVVLFLECFSVLRFIYLLSHLEKYLEVLYLGL